MFNIYMFPLSEWDVWIAGQKPKQPRVESVYTWCMEEKADLCFNLGFFDMKQKLACSEARGRNGYIAYGGASNVLYLNSQNWCRGYANAIVDGDVRVDTPHTLGGRSLRNGIGITTDNQVIVAQTSHDCTELEFALAVNKFVKGRGRRVELFVLEDGGGSVSEWSAMSKLGFFPREVRKVATVVCFKRKKKPVFKRTISYGVDGEDTRELQTCLGGIEADGIARNGTRNRIIAAQKALGLKADGYAGPLTMAALYRNE